MRKVTKLESKLRRSQQSLDHLEAEKLIQQKDIIGLKFELQDESLKRKE